MTRRLVPMDEGERPTLQSAASALEDSIGEHPLVDYLRSLASRYESGIDEEEARALDRADYSDAHNAARLKLRALTEED